jgi:hypothetical protein
LTDLGLELSQEALFSFELAGRFPFPRTDSGLFAYVFQSPLAIPYVSFKLAPLFRVCKLGKSVFQGLLFQCSLGSSCLIVREFLPHLGKGCGGLSDSRFFGLDALDGNLDSDPKYRGSFNGKAKLMHLIPQR